MSCKVGTWLADATRDDVMVRHLVVMNHERTVRQMKSKFCGCELHLAEMPGVKT